MVPRGWRVALARVELDGDRVERAGPEVAHQVRLLGLHGPEPERGVARRQSGSAGARTVARKDWKPPIRKEPVTSAAASSNREPGERERALDVLGRLGERQPGRGEDAAGRHPPEQGVTRLTLELGDLLGHRGGGYAQLVGRGEDAAVACDGEQEAQSAGLDLHFSNAKPRMLSKCNCANACEPTMVSVGPRGGRV